MEKLRINKDNERYYSEAFIKGWKTGVEAQFNADVREQRPKGEWIDRSGGIEGAWHYCSVCGNSAINNFDFCPNCGARMVGNNDEK